MPNRAIHLVHLLKCPWCHVWPSCVGWGCPSSWTCWCSKGTWRACCQRGDACGRGGYTFCWTTYRTPERQKHNSQYPIPLCHTLYFKKNQPLSLTLHLNGLTGRWTIMCVLRVCFWTKVLKQTWHWKGLTLAWINMCLFRLADRVNSLAQTSHLNSFIPWGNERGVWSF